MNPLRNPPLFEPPRVAVIGAGIAGLSAALRMQPQAEVTVFEQASYMGGHAHTVEVAVGDCTFPVDTGFLVFNHRTYPGLTHLFQQLGIATSPSNMGFSVQSMDGVNTLEWAGNDLGAVFAQPSNSLRPRFWGMLWELLRFNRLATETVQSLEKTNTAFEEMSLASFLDRHRFGVAFRQDYLLPMIACIWSCPEDQMLQFPALTLLRFCHNHGLLSIRNRPQWLTVTGGSQVYVQQVLSQLKDCRPNTQVQKIERFEHGVLVHTLRGSEHFDAIVLCTHPPEALDLLGSAATSHEQEILQAIKTQANQGVLHTDTSVMPKSRRAWAAWNFERNNRMPERKVSLHYWLNDLQPLPTSVPVLLSLNPLRPIAQEQILGEFEYHHPVFDLAAIQAQKQLPTIQGQNRTWYAGAWCGYGFHEDGYQAGYRAAEAVLEQLC